MRLLLGIPYGDRRHFDLTCDYLLWAVNALPLRKSPSLV